MLPSLLGWSAWHEAGELARTNPPASQHLTQLLGDGDAEVGPTWHLPVQEPAEAGGEPPAEPALEIRRELLGESVVAVVDERATGQARHDETRDRRLIVVRVDDLDCLIADPPPEAHGEKQVAPETARARPRAFGHPRAIAHDVDRMATHREPTGKLLHEDL